jgi:hypothetical protein
MIAFVLAGLFLGSLGLVMTGDRRRPRARPVRVEAADRNRPRRR